jgi:hypothetical protein
MEFILFVKEKKKKKKGVREGNIFKKYMYNIYIYVCVCMYVYAFLCKSLSLFWKQIFCIKYFFFFLNIIKHFYIIFLKAKNIYVYMVCKFIYFLA